VPPFSIPRLRVLIGAACAAGMVATAAQAQTAGELRDSLDPNGGRRPAVPRNDTGFVSMRQGPVVIPTPPTPPPSVRGQSPAAAAAPPRRRPPAEDDPFAPTGVRVGAFTLRPAIEVSGGYDSNPGQVEGGGGSSMLVVAPELTAQSDWERHALGVDIRGTYTAYREFPDLDRPDLTGTVTGRIDVTSRTWIDLEGRAHVATEDPGSPDLPADVAKLPLYTRFGGTAGVAHRFNRLEVALKGSVDRTEYQDSELTDGTTVSNADRNYEQYGTQIRGSYDLMPGVAPFVEVGLDRREHDLPVDAFGLQRDSQGVSARAGSSFALGGKLTGEASAGYLARRYEDPTLQDLRGFLFDASLVWTATPLTTVRLTGKTTVDETTQPGVSGILRRDVALQVDHAFRRWLVGTVRLGYGIDDYQGDGREDRRYEIAGGLTYKLNRSMQLKGELRHVFRHSNVPGNDYTANIALVGLRLQR